MIAILNMNQKMLIAAIVTAAALTGLFATSPLAYAEEYLIIF
jgi:hypothetical protein